MGKKGRGGERRGLKGARYTMSTQEVWGERCGDNGGRKTNGVKCGAYPTVRSKDGRCRDHGAGAAAAWGATCGANGGRNGEGESCDKPPTHGSKDGRCHLHSVTEPGKREEEDRTPQQRADTLWRKVVKGAEHRDGDLHAEVRCQCSAFVGGGACRVHREKGRGGIKPHVLSCVWWHQLTTRCVPTLPATCAGAVHPVRVPVPRVSVGPSVEGLSTRAGVP